MIRFEGVVEGGRGPCSLSVPPGTLCVILATSTAEKTWLLDLMLGRRAPERGAVRLLGKDVHALPELAATQCYRRIGVVPHEGGTISNLKVWENLVLPLWYRKGWKPSDAEDAALEWMNRLGSPRPDLARLMASDGGSLTSVEKRMVCLVRAFLMNPALLILDAPFEGLDPQTALRWSAVIADFHRSLEERATVYVTTDERALEVVSPDRIVRIDATRTLLATEVAP